MIRYIELRRPSSPRTPNTPRTLVVAIVACLCILSAAGLTASASADASANASAKIMELCAHGQSVAGFTVKQYQATLENLTTEEIEYHSECVEAIQKADLAAAGRKGDHRFGGSPRGRSLDGGSPIAGQAVEPTPTQARMLEATRMDGAPAVRLGDRAGGSTFPGVVHPDLASAASDLPPAVLAVVAAAIGGILLLAVHDVRERTRRSLHESRSTHRSSYN